MTFSYIDNRGDFRMGLSNYRGAVNDIYSSCLVISHISEDEIQIEKDRYGGFKGQVLNIRDVVSFIVKYMKNNDVSLSEILLIDMWGKSMGYNDLLLMLPRLDGYMYEEVPY